MSPSDSRSPGLVTFLTDFGYGDEYAGVCRLVMTTADPPARVVDITHGIPPGDVRRGALALAAAVRFSPRAVHLAVVDPGVGTNRRAIVLQAGGHHLVGPENVLLMPASEALGGVEAAFDISDTPLRVGDSDTFHGRDVFSPVAAALAGGAAAGEVGAPVGFSDLTQLDLPRPEITPEALTGHVLFLDQYGNASLDLYSEALRRTFLTESVAVWMETPRQKMMIPFGRTFGDVATGEPVLFLDSSGHLAIAVNRGSAASRFGLVPDDVVRITPAASA
ncbi:MAG: SAM-dependent chlorinase/fluorinase [Solirubrobacterales bacterium]|nr:SAM-dependent chlorinase/fluorinase [Solirubrobacterales bacterium]